MGQNAGEGWMVVWVVWYVPVGVGVGLGSLGEDQVGEWVGDRWNGPVVQGRQEERQFRLGVWSVVEC